MLPGRHTPLGATHDGAGVNFALFSKHASAVELCLFDDQGVETKVHLPEKTQHVWHGYVPGLAPGARYGFRVHGPFEPNAGHRFNPRKLLVDPYAKAIDGKIDYQAPVYGYRRLPLLDEEVPDLGDSARGVPKSVVMAGDAPFDWRGDERPAIPWARTVIYETHVKGLTRLLDEVPSSLRGTYLGLVTPPVLRHLKALGVTALELLPVHEIMDDDHVVQRGKTNFWGYNSLGFFAPEQRYASRPGEQVREFKEMVRRLHAEGFEVLLDVVYNHSCEGNHLGPTVCWRGIDNAAYYHLKTGKHGRYEDFTGCGNSFQLGHPQVLKMVLDSLRYWVTEMHVDGFRFDLASTLARPTNAYDKSSAFFSAIHQDPTLSGVKLIAEPWDLGDGGYQVGNFPVDWAEWNGRYRDTVRRFWKGSSWAVGEFASRLSGSSDLYQDDGRKPQASINFVTAHDGFTLRDLVSYSRKRNEENGENNKDGADDNDSDPCGFEGETSESDVLQLRQRQMRNFIATLLLSQGVPMLRSGDEFSKTQGGNNNAYCLDNEVSWLSWDLDDDQKAFLKFFQEMVAFRSEHPNLMRRHFFLGAPVRQSRGKDVAWFRADGAEMRRQDWESPSLTFLAMLLSGDAMACTDANGEVMTDDTFLMLFQGEDKALTVRLPDAVWGKSWRVRVDTHRPFAGGEELFQAAETVSLPPRSLMILERVQPTSGSWRPPPLPYGDLA